MPCFKKLFFKEFLKNDFISFIWAPVCKYNDDFFYLFFLRYSKSKI